MRATVSLGPINMTCFKAPIGKAAQLSVAPPGRLLLTRSDDDGKVALLISLATANEGGDEYYLALSSEAKLSGLVFKRAFHESGWDVTDFAQIEPILTDFSVNGDGARHGVIATDENGSRVIGSVTHGGGGRAWFSFDTWKHAKAEGVYQICFPSWRLVAPNDHGEPTTLFEWPPNGA